VCFLQNCRANRDRQTICMFPDRCKLLAWGPFLLCRVLICGPVYRSVKSTEILGYLWDLYLLTYFLTVWSLIGFQLVKKFSAFYGTRIFITTFRNACHLSLSWASSIQSVTPQPTFWRSTLILSSHLCLGLLRPLKLEFLCHAPFRTGHKKRN